MKFDKIISVKLTAYIGCAIEKTIIKDSLIYKNYSLIY